MSQFTFARRGACYPRGAGDFRGPVTGAAGTRHFEPDGVAFCAQACLPRPHFECRAAFATPSDRCTKAEKAAASSPGVVGVLCSLKLITLPWGAGSPDPSTASSLPANLTKLFWRADETVFWDGEGVLKPTSPMKEPDQQRGSIMWAFITNLVYGLSCEKYLADLARHRHYWI